MAVGLTNTTHFLRSLTSGRVRVEAMALNQGRTQQLWQVDVTDGSGKRLAHGEVRLQNLTAPGSEVPSGRPLSQPRTGRRQMGMTTDADVIVIGAGLAGLTAAATASRAGSRVTVLEAHGPGGRARTAERAGFILNMGAHALYRGGVGMRVLGALGIRPEGAPHPCRATGRFPGVGCTPSRRGPRPWSAPASSGPGPRPSWPGCSARSRCCDPSSCATPR